MIRKLIADENPQKPLSDDMIAQCLSQKGIQVARRTVAKYREVMAIPSSTDRNVSLEHSEACRRDGGGQAVTNGFRMRVRRIATPLQPDPDKPTSALQRTHDANQPDRTSS